MYIEFKQYRWYKIITYNFKKIQIFSRPLEIGVQDLWCCLPKLATVINTKI